MTSFWTDAGGTGQNVLMVNTTGDQLEPAQKHIPGGVTGSVANQLSDSDKSTYDALIAQRVTASADVRTTASIADTAKIKSDDATIVRNTAFDTQAAALTARTDANSALTAAQTTLASDLSALNTAETTLQTATTDLDTAQAALDADIAAGRTANYSTLLANRDAARTAYNNAYTARQDASRTYTASSEAAAAAQSTFDSADAAYQTATTNYNTAETARLTAEAAYTTALTNANTAATTLASIDAQIATLEATLKGSGVHPVTYSAQAVYPHYDGFTNTLPVADRPADFADDNPATFSTWHSAYQAEWIAARNGAGSITTISVSGTDVYYLLTTDGKSVIPVNSLEQSEIGKLSTADQQVLVNNATVWANLQATYNLSATTTGGGTTVQAIYAEIQAGASVMGDDHLVFLDKMDLLIARNNNSAIVDQDMLDEKAAEILDRFNRAYQFANTPDEDIIRFLGYYNEGGSLSINDYRVTLKTSYNTYSSDHGQTVGEGYEEFMRAERSILSSKMAREAIAPVAGGFNDPRLDVPSLIYRLQSMYEIEAGGVETAETEELLQLYALLDDYAIMQAMINETIKPYNVEDTDQVRRFMNVDGTGGTDDNNVPNPESPSNDDVDSFRLFYGTTVDNSFFLFEDTDSFANQNWFYSLQEDTSNWDAFITAATSGSRKVNWVSAGVLSDEQMRIFSMFSSDYFTNSADSPHPLETLYGIDRPLQQFVDDNDGEAGRLARYEKSVWDTYSTQLSDTVTQLNQQVQLKQNDISDATKEKNRHFELGNNALTKMYDMIGQIARM